MIRKAVIVAAGRSTRLYPLTVNRPKALLHVGKESLLERSVRLLRAHDITEVGVVVGYHADMIREALGNAITCIANPFYEHCNNMGSLWMAKSFVGDDAFAFLHGDLIYTEEMLGNFLREAADSPAAVDLLTAFGPVDDEAMKVRASDNGRLLESAKTLRADDAQGEWTGIAVVHHPDVLFGAIERHLLNGGLSDYDTAAFTALATRGEHLHCVSTSGAPWKEIDTLEDLEAARAEFGRV